MHKLGFLLLLLLIPSAAAQSISIKRMPVDSGVVLSTGVGSITLKDSKGVKRAYQIQSNKKEPLMVSGTRLNLPAEIEVTGELTVDALREGAFVIFDIDLARTGRNSTPVERMEWMAEDAPAPSAKLLGEGAGKSKKYRVAAPITRKLNGKLVLTVPRSQVAPRGVLTINVSEQTKVNVKSSTLSLVRAGDKAVSFEPVAFSTGDFAIKSIQIELGQASEQRSSTIDDRLAQKHAAKSDEPGKPREVRSQHFILQTDISERQAAILLDKLETMIALVSQYYRRPPTDVIRCFVIEDLAKWTNVKLEPTGVIKIQNGEGVTISRSLGEQRSSMVYSCDDHQVVQHEAVHAYCFQSFGSTGPTWYSEGMAEMGAYWQAGERAVNIRKPIINYLTNAPPKRMLDIVAAGQITGDSWQAYAWRWALCHMLASNPNYAKRFNALGPAMMSGQPVSFETTFGDIAAEISFEYDQFVENFGNGYRADLCAWQWKPAKPLAKKGLMKRKIVAAAGWQASQLKVAASESYEFATKGEWQTDAASEPTSAAGQADGQGRLIGAVLSDDFELSEPFELGQRGTFTAPADGHLYLRCRDEWTELGDNQGEMTVHLRLPKK